MFGNHKAFLLGWLREIKGNLLHFLIHQGRMRVLMEVVRFGWVVVVRKIRFGGSCH